MQILVATLRGAVRQPQRATAYAALLPSLPPPLLLLSKILTCASELKYALKKYCTMSLLSTKLELIELIKRFFRSCPDPLFHNNRFLPFASALLRAKFATGCLGISVMSVHPIQSCANLSREPYSSVTVRPEVESSRIHFEVLGLGLEASKTFFFEIA